MVRPIFWLCIAVCITSLAFFNLASAKTDRFKQWIAPLECTKSYIINGDTVTTILSPEECDEWLNPKPPSGGGTVKPPVTPGAPSTGFYQDPIVGLVQFSFWIFVLWVAILVARRRADDDLSK